MILNKGYTYHAGEVLYLSCSVMGYLEKLSIARDMKKELPHSSKNLCGLTDLLKLCRMPPIDLNSTPSITGKQ